MTVLAALFYIIYSIGLGAAGVLAYAYASGWLRYVPALLTAVYYVLAYQFPHRIIRELKQGETVHPGEDWRFITACLIITISLYLLAQALKREEYDHYPDR